MYQPFLSSVYEEEQNMPSSSSSRYPGQPAWASAACLSSPGALTLSKFSTSRSTRPLPQSFTQIS